MILQMYTYMCTCIMTKKDDFVFIKYDNDLWKDELHPLDVVWIFGVAWCNLLHHLCGQRVHCLLHLKGQSHEIYLICWDWSSPSPRWAACALSSSPKGTVSWDLFNLLGLIFSITSVGSVCTVFFTQRDILMRFILSVGTDLPSGTKKNSLRRINLSFLDWSPRPP